MPLIMSSDQARNFLFEKGFPITARLTRRKRPYGKTDLRKRRNESKIADVYVCGLGKFDRTDNKDITVMRNLAPFSGFHLLGEWKKEIVKLNDLDSWEEVPETIYLSAVSLINRCER